MVGWVWEGREYRLMITPVSVLTKKDIGAL